MQRWEILRRAQQRYTVARLAEESRSSIEAVQRSLDLLLDVKLVVRNRATTRAPQVTYASAVRRLIVVWSRKSPEDRANRRAFVDGERSSSRAILEACPSYRDGPRDGQFGVGGATSVLLLKEDALAVREALIVAYATLAGAEQRALAAAPGLAKPYHLALEFHEMQSAGLPMPELFVCEEGAKEECRHRVIDAASMVLSPRELQIARAMSAGKLRPQIASDLGLAENTVATVSKRIYRKLGVNNRSALVVRLRGV